MRIQNKFLVPSLVLTCLSLTVFGVIFLKNVGQQEEHRFERKVALTDRLLSEGTRDLLWNLDQEGVDALCQEVFADPEVLRVQVSDPSGAVTVRLPDTESAEVPPVTVTSSFEIERGGRSVGSAVVIYSRAAVEGRIQRVVFLFAGLVAAMIGGLLATYWVLAQSVAKPVEAIVKAMKDVSGGDYRARLNLRVDDEFSDVETVFNQMVEGVEESHLRDTRNNTKLEEQTSLLAQEIEGRKLTEEALRQAQKMEALARLSGGIAHDFNNLLTSILGFSSMAQDQLSEHDQAYADIEEVVRAGERARDLTQQLLDLGRQRQVELRPLDVNAVLTGLESLLRRTLGEDVALITELDESVGTVVADDMALQQVVVNLADNAHDAMPNGGKLTISTEEVFLEKADLADLPDIDVGSYAKIVVKDTGVGMSADVKAYVFEPFFTTKKEGQGTGLGLSTVHGIVRQCKGAISFDSKRGRGTEFRIYLPLATAEDSGKEARPVDEVVGGNETVLLVEDEDSVRRLTHRILKELGYKVLDACDGTEGLQLAKEHTGPLDLILSDVVMPQMRGPDMVEEIKKLRNDYRVLYMSGFSQEEIPKTDSDGRPVHLILKPFTRDVVARRVREVLDEDRSTSAR